MAREVIIRKAELDDMRAVFELSNDPLVRTNSIHSEPIEWMAHEKWFANALTNSRLKFYIAESAGGALIGQVRFEEREGGCLVSISLAAAFRGKGLSQAVLQKAMDASGFQCFMAEICADNLTSLSLFKRCGFELQADGSFIAGERKFERMRRKCL